jgi:hypothetical protein
VDRIPVIQVMEVQLVLVALMTVAVLFPLEIVLEIISVMEQIAQRFPVKKSLDLVVWTILVFALHLKRA